MKLYAPTMLQQPLSLSFLILSIIFSSLSVSTANSNVYALCSQVNFTSTTPYESNVNSLFTSLIDSASYYNFNTFQSSPQTDVVYGLFQCRGDLSSPNCKDCVADAINQLKSTCPTSTGGQIQLEGCFVKYEDTSFFGVQDTTEVYRRCGPSTGYNSDVLNRRDDALAKLVGANGEYFRSGDFASIQGVAQCVQDLSLSDCQDCLSETSGRLRSECETSTWGDMYLGKCYIRYANQGNLNNDNDNGESKRRRKGRKINLGNWIASFIGAFIGGGLTIGFAFACNCCNINVYQNQINILKRDLEGAKKEAESAKTEAKSLKETLEKSSKQKTKMVEEEVKSEPKFYAPPMRMQMAPPGSYMAMPPPCPYVAHSSPNACYYL